MQRPWGRGKPGEIVALAMVENGAAGPRLDLGCGQKIIKVTEVQLCLEPAVALGLGKGL